jgi:transposase
MNMLSETVDVVIGVDTHKHTHTAAVVQAATGAEVENDLGCGW